MFAFKFKLFKPTFNSFTISIGFPVSVILPDVECIDISSVSDFIVFASIFKTSFIFKLGLIFVSIPVADLIDT